MDEDDERGGGGVGLGRTLALSDGIFAIAMTLLAFQIQLPTLGAGNGHNLSTALGRQGDSYFVYVLSFAVIGRLWLAHHRLFSHVQRADEALMAVNLVFLMAVAALPFPSAVLGRYGSQPIAVVLYASLMAAAGYLLTALTLVARRRLLTPDATAAGIRRGLWRSGSMAAIFTLSIPVGVVAPAVAPFTWLLIVPVRALTGGRGKRSTPPAATV
jgi:uncharacterized membrane protein